jgi:hypothetical protein
VRFAGEWAWAVSQFARLARPDAYLLRVDWLGRGVQSISLYCRFPREPDDVMFAELLAAAQPFRWRGPAPHDVASVLQLPGPRGVGLRVDALRRLHMALYFRVPASVTSLEEETVERLVDVCGYPESVAESVRTDLRVLYHGRAAGVIGVDAGSDHRAAALKFNPSNVPLDQALTFLAAKGASAARLEQLGALAQTLRGSLVSYLGVRYDANGFSGWRTYFSAQPRRIGSAGVPRVVIEPNSIPTLPLPHY